MKAASNSMERVGELSTKRREQQLVSQTYHANNLKILGALIRKSRCVCGSALYRTINSDPVNVWLERDCNLPNSPPFSNSLANQSMRARQPCLGKHAAGLFGAMAAGSQSASENPAAPGTSEDEV